MSRLLLALMLYGSLGYGSLSAQTKEPYKIAVIGLVHTHVWGHLRTMLDGKDARLVGIADPHQELLDEALKAGAQKELLFSNYDEMLDKTKPDIVWAFVENNRHFEIAKECAPRHINMIFEKPLASNYEEAKAVASLAGKYHVMVMTNYQMAWWPANYVAKTAADKGEIGPVFSLHGIVGNGGPGPEGTRNKYFFEWLTDPVKNGGGALVDFGCYNVLWSLWYLGMPTQVYATVDHIRPDRFPKVEDEAVIVLTYPQAVGVFEGSWELPRSFQDLEVIGRSLDGQKGGTLMMTHRGVEEQHGGTVTQLPLEPLAADAAEPIAYMVSHMRSGEAIGGMTALPLNVNVVRILDLAKRSVKTGSAVKVELQSGDKE